MNFPARPFDDPLDDVFGPVVSNTPAPIPTREVPVVHLPQAKPNAFVEKCRKCGGSGRWRPGYPCFGCKGTGKLTFRQAPEVRAQKRAQVETRKRRTAEEAIAAFRVEHPDVWAWLDGNPFGLAVKYLEDLKRYGSLTEGKLETARRMIAKREEARAAAAVRRAPVSLKGIETAFAKALEAGKKQPILRMPGGLKLSYAKAASVNAGAIYVKRTGGEYLGKIVQGEFRPVYACTDADKAALLEAAEDPLAAAVRYGRETSSCSCCGRELTDPVSIERGIGPICAEGYGW
jgi:hypothetical protein